MSEHTFTDDNFKSDVANGSGVILVDFYADWCGPCKMMAPVIEEISQEYKDAKIGKLNVDENQQTAGEFGVQSIPTLVIFKDGKEVDRLIGFQNKDVIMDALEKAKNA